MRPFLLDRASQFRADPPPALDSRRYAKDLNETQAYGALNSTVRTDEQKAIAYFWVGNNINQYNEAMQSLVAQHDMDLVDAVHLLAMGNIVSTDAGIACYDSKFFYQFWRPITAIQDRRRIAALIAASAPLRLRSPTGLPAKRLPQGCRRWTVSTRRRGFGASVIASWLVGFGIINSYNPIARGILRALHGLTEPVLGPIRRVMPALGGLDLSPLIALILIYFLQRLIVRMLFF
jgi:uncharacterized protein YggT (Ycf19 family)